MNQAADRARLEGLPRAELIAEGRRRGVQRPEVMTRLELLDEILRLATPDPADRRRLRGWLGVARDLIASAVERGLHLPDAARMIRGEVRFDASPEPGRHVATVTLAEIYAAQGHGPRAIGILEQVLAREPDHEVARALLERVRADVRAGAVAAPPPEEPDPVDDPVEGAASPPPGPLPGGDCALEGERRGDGVVRLRATHLPDGAGALTLRLVSFEPAAGGARRVARDLALPPGADAVEFRGVPARAELRAALLERRGARLAVRAIWPE